MRKWYGVGSRVQHFNGIVKEMVWKIRRRRGLRIRWRGSTIQESNGSNEANQGQLQIQGHSLVVVLNKASIATTKENCICDRNWNPDSLLVLSVISSAASPFFLVIFFLVICLIRRFLSCFSLLGVCFRDGVCGSKAEFMKLLDRGCW